MIPVAFDYKRANTVDEAIEALSASEAKILAGGHSLIPAMKLRLNQPSILIDISKIAALKTIKTSGSEIVIGAGATYNEISSSTVIREHLPLFSQGADLVG